jgi:pyrroloquinoline quinone biosynthesis protein B
MLAIIRNEMSKYYIYVIMLLISACGNKQSSENNIKEKINQGLNPKATSLVILGTIQDAGSPHMGCKKACCKNLFSNPDKDRQVVALGLFDEQTNKKYLFEATPDMPRQMKLLKEYGTPSEKEVVDGIFLTHAHIGHYTGLMYLGKEAMDAKNTPIFAMPRMKDYLENNGPWSQLVARNNIILNKMENQQAIRLSNEIEVTPFLVPHRDEYSETVGFFVKGPNKSALFIPDIDKWDKWNKNIVEEIKKVDYAFLDATFYSGKEINNRDISQIPHPFIIESIEKFYELNEQERNKVIFIHFNHTNPVIDPKSDEAKNVLNRGFRIGKINDIFEL